MLFIDKYILFDRRAWLGYAQVEYAQVDVRRQRKGITRPRARCCLNWYAHCMRHCRYQRACTTAGRNALRTHMSVVCAEIATGRAAVAAVFVAGRRFCCSAAACCFALCCFCLCCCSLLVAAGAAAAAARMRRWYAHTHSGETSETERLFSGANHSWSAPWYAPDEK